MAVKHGPLLCLSAVTAYFIGGLWLANLFGVQRHPIVSTAIGIPCGIGIIVAFTLVIDAYRSIKVQDGRSTPDRLLLLIYAPFYHFTGIFSLLFGITMIAWVLYNSLVERLESYSGGFLTLGIGPAMVIYGIWRIRTDYFASDDVDDTDEGDEEGEDGDNPYGPST